MELSRYLREYSRTIEGKQQLIIASFAKALEVIPRQIADNAGFDATDILNKLRQKHATGKFWFIFTYVYNVYIYLFELLIYMFLKNGLLNSKFMYNTNFSFLYLN